MSAASAPSEDPAEIEGAEGYDFLVSRDDYRRPGFVPQPDHEGIALEPGQALLGIDSLSMTANNVTYAVMGEAIGYWRFFPAPEGWGRVPAWGYAEVVRSAHDALPAGRRLYGFLPISTHLVVEPAAVEETGFVDGAEHRRELPAVYNRYGYSAAGEHRDPAAEPLNAMLSPLFTTSFVLADQLEEEGFAGAERLLVSSASSKTALGLAFCLRRARKQAPAPVPEVIGLTSRGNLAFVEATGLYDRAVSYDELEGLLAGGGEATAYADFAANAELNRRVHEGLGDSLRASLIVGASDWEHMAGPDAGAELPGPARAFFFAPDRVEKRSADWGAKVLRNRVAQAQDELVRASAGWFEVRRASGPSAVLEAWRATLDGRVEPSTCLSLTP